MADAVEDRIRAHCFRNRIRIEEFFGDFDKLRSGFCTVTQFRRALSMLGFLLSEEHFNALAERYVNDARGAVHYAAFCDSIEKVFTTKHLEKTPTVAPPRIAVPRVDGAAPSLSPRSAEQCDAILDRLRAFVHTRRIHVKSFFQDFDRLNRGVVTAGQFRRGINTGLHLSDAETDLLTARYASPNGIDVDYADFHKDVDFSDEEASFVRHSGSLGSTRSAVESVDIEDRLRALVLQHRIRVEEFIRDFDPLRSGLVTADQFRRALGAIKFPRFSLREADLEELALRYAAETPDGARMVRWRAFCANMEAVFTTPGLEKTPTAQVVPPQIPDGVLRHVRADVGDSALDDVLGRIARRIATRRILMKPIFQDFDRAATGICGRGVVSRDRFRRALSSLAFSLSDADYELLFSRYCDPHDADGDVNYLLFLEDVEDKDEQCS